jgi:predicted transcriptional regulator of viral defense system
VKTVVHKEIEKKFTKSKKGQILFISDFRGMGSEAAIRKALSRLTKENKVKRIAHGIYLVPEIDPLLGKRLPSMEKIAEAIAGKEQIRIKPSGAYALHKLGLSTQVPMKLVYLTEGSQRSIRIGKSLIKFKHTTPKKVALEGELSSLIVQALEELGTENLEQATVKRIKELLQKEKSKTLIHDLKLAPGKISEFLYTLLKT